VVIEIGVPLRALMVQPAVLVASRKPAGIGRFPLVPAAERRGTFIVPVSIGAAGKGEMLRLRHEAFEGLAKLGVAAGGFVAAFQIGPLLSLWQEPQRDIVFQDLKYGNPIEPLGSRAPDHCRRFVLCAGSRRRDLFPA